MAGPRIAVMPWKQSLKQLLVGSAARPFRLPVGLGRGLRLQIDPAHEFQRLIGMDELEIVRPVRRAAAGARSEIDVGGSDGYSDRYFAAGPPRGRPRVRLLAGRRPEGSGRGEFPTERAGVD